MWWQSIVKQKEDILREYELSKHQLEDELKRLKTEIEIREQKVTTQEAEIAKLDDTKRQVESQIRSLYSNLEERENTIKEQERIIKELDSTKKKIEVNLKEQIEDQQIQLKKMEGKLKVTFIDKILFDSGSVEINPNGKKLLSTLAQTLREQKGQTIIIQGHTDNVKIGPDLRKIYPTNWELSAGRSTAVLRYLIENTGIDPQRSMLAAIASTIRLPQT